MNIIMMVNKRTHNYDNAITRVLKFIFPLRGVAIKKNDFTEKLFLQNFKIDFNFTDLEYHVPQLDDFYIVVVGFDFVDGSQ